MSSKKTVSGKHPLTVRVTEEDYAIMRRVAAEYNESVNEMIVEIAREEVRRLYLEIFEQEIE